MRKIEIFHHLLMTVNAESVKRGSIRPILRAETAQRKTDAPIQSRSACTRGFVESCMSYFVVTQVM